MVLGIPRHCEAHTSTAGGLCGSIGVWRFATYYGFVGGVESMISKALFGTVSSQARHISPLFLRSISFYIYHPFFIRRWLGVNIAPDKHYELIVWLD